MQKLFLASFIYQYNVVYCIRYHIFLAHSIKMTNQSSMNTNVVHVHVFVEVLMCCTESERKYIRYVYFIFY